METTASDYFASRTQEYDSLIQRAVPRYDEMIARMVEYLPAQPGRILELGCGTGNYSIALAAAYPEAEITLVDGAAEMLEMTARRLRAERRGIRIQTMCARFEDVDLEPGSYDLITSCIAIHHVEDKATLFLRLREALEAGGHLVYADQMAGETEACSRINWGAMAAFWKLPGHLTPEECKELEEHADVHDHYVSIVAQLRLLEQAGFRELDVVWRHYMWGVITSRA